MSLRDVTWLVLFAAAASGCSVSPSGGGASDASAVSSDGAVRPGDAAGTTHAGRVPPFPLVDGEIKELDLSALSPSVAGCKLRFKVQLTGNPATLAKLSDITLVGGASTGAHLRSPSFAIYEPTDLVNPVRVGSDYAGSEVVIDANDTTTFYPSLVLLTDYRAGRLVDFGASLVEPFDGPLDLKPSGGGIHCKNIPGFDAFKPRLMGQGVGLNCNGCHFAGVGGFSTSGFDNPAYDDASCTSVLVMSNVATPAMSSFYLSVRSGGTHKNGTLNAADSQTMLNALTTWLATEK